MTATFTFQVDFMRYPLMPPTKPNCEKCFFHGVLCNHLEGIGRPQGCGYGMNGYYVSVASSKNKGILE
jgi:hypothetical protein